MAKRANQAFISYHGGFKRTFQKDQVVPDDVAGKVDALVYEDGADKPKRTTRRNSDD